MNILILNPMRNLQLLYKTEKHYYYLNPFKISDPE